MAGKSAVQRFFVGFSFAGGIAEPAINPNKLVPLTLGLGQIRFPAARRRCSRGGGFRGWRQSRPGLRSSCLNAIAMRGAAAGSAVSRRRLPAARTCGAELPCAWQNARAGYRRRIPLQVPGTGSTGRGVGRVVHRSFHSASGVRSAARTSGPAAAAAEVDTGGVQINIRAPDAVTFDTI